MKKYLLILAMAILALPMSAQKLKVNKVDKFTGETVQSTSYETLFSVNFMASGFIYRYYFNIQKNNEKYTMFAEILLKEIVKYDNSSKVYLLLDDNDKVILKSNYTGVGGEKWANGYIFKTSFDMTPGDVEKLKTHKVTDIRIEYMDGYYDHAVKKQDLIMKMLNLFK